MKNTHAGFIIVALTGSSLAGEPNVVEQQRPDGLTELRVVSENGPELAAYTVDLKTHHHPATSDTGPIRQWATYRYGGFFCFNDNQFGGGERSVNKDAAVYNPARLDVAGWAKAMKQAGMRYAVLTTRHTSGFLLWDSATTEFDVASSPVPNDVVGEFVEACRREGIVPGLYYCMWGNKQWMPNPNARAVILAQLAELATRYGEIPYFWMDVPKWRPDDLSAQEVYDALKNWQPNAVVIMNNNQGIEKKLDRQKFPTDVLNGEITVPLPEGYKPYCEVEGRRYFLPYEFEPVSQRFVPGAKTGGTRTPQGRVGVWFTYGEGQAVPLSQPFPVEVLFDWIKQGYDRGAANVLLSLAADHTGSMRADDVRQLVELGNRLRSAGLLEAPPAAPHPRDALSINKPARASSVWEDNTERFGAAWAFDNDSSTRWAGGVDMRAGWLEVDLGAETEVGRVVIQEGWNRTLKVSVKYKAGDVWNTAVEGDTIGAQRVLSFDPVTARIFRLHITQSAEVPTIWEFQLFPPAD